MEKYSKVIRGFTGGIDVQVFTDGSCYPNPGDSGHWAHIVKYRPNSPGGLPCNVVKTSGTEVGYCTNNRMELMAAIMGLRSLPQPSTVELITDSEYLAKGLCKITKYSREDRDVVNGDLWRDLAHFSRIHTVFVTVVKGHNGQEENEECDQMCESLRLGYQEKKNAEAIQKLLNNGIYQRVQQNV